MTGRVIWSPPAATAPSSALDTLAFLLTAGLDTLHELSRSTRARAARKAVQPPCPECAADLLTPALLLGVVPEAFHSRLLALFSWGPELRGEAIRFYARMDAARWHGCKLPDEAIRFYARMDAARWHGCKLPDEPIRLTPMVDKIAELLRQLATDAAPILTAARAEAAARDAGDAALADGTAVVDHAERIVRIDRSPNDDGCGGNAA